MADVSRPGHGGAGSGVFTWNVRWLVDPLAAAASSKRAVVLRAVLRGDVALLQETHWDEQAAAIWASSFPGCTVKASPAILGPDGGRAGGVAVILPPGHVAVETRHLAPGQCLLVHARAPVGVEYRVCSVYARPADRQPALDALRSLQGGEGPELYVGGDFNVQIGAPQTPDEELEAAGIDEWAAAQGMACVSCGAPTYMGGAEGDDRAAEIDYLFIPRHKAAATRAACLWHRSLSDHATLSLRQAARQSAGTRPCTPAGIRSLHPSAAADLRLRFSCLEALFGLNETGDEAGASTEGMEVAWNPGLALHGEIFLRLTIQGWWQRWQRRTPGGGGILPGLVAIAAGTDARPVGPELREWLRAYEEASEFLHPA